MFNLRSLMLSGCFAVLALPAYAAGTYYTGAAYQPTQYRYGQSGTYATSGYGNTGYTRSTNSMSSVRYNNYAQPNATYQQSSVTRQQSSSRPAQTAQQASATNGGFFANAGISHETAMWKFEMTNIANSILHYDNIAWNVLDLNGGYVFGLGKTKMQVDAGFKYGLQWGETTMIDDDISNGGYIGPEFDDGTYLPGHALSVGASKDGSMWGFNAGVGLTDFFKWGNLKMTPSIGYRYFKHNLETKNNYGIMMITSACFDLGDGQIQCDPAMFGWYNAGSGLKQQLFWRDSLDEYPSAVFDIQGQNYYTQAIDYGDTYYYEQSGVTHSYGTVWSGPYIAMDMVYDINQNNNINGRVELGFPGYKSTGDQPYRWDWEHPKSVEDSANMFSAFHLGMLANWKTAITNSVWLSLGMTYDYYSVSGASAKTYLNKGLYDQVVASNNGDEQALLDFTLNDTLYTYLLNKYNYSSATPEQQAQIAQIVQYNFISDSNLVRYLDKSQRQCGGWICKSSKEVDSIYKSMGFRIGIDARF